MNEIMEARRLVLCGNRYLLRFSATPLSWASIVDIIMFGSW